MKLVKTFFILFLVCFVGISEANTSKHALIIAVGNYPLEGGWNKISSMNDVALIEQALFAQGFEGKNMILLTDADATYSGIENAFKALESKVKIGDIVVIHFSGHGQQIEDNNNDEIDGYDESIIPYDARLNYQKGVYEGEHHFRDDELGRNLSQIRKKVGPQGNVLVILDSCHSGTGTRGDRVSRGTGEKFQSKDYHPISSSRGSESGGFCESKETDDAAPLVVISGASAEQLNYEYTDENGVKYGSLSFALSKALTEVNHEMTYRGLFDAVQKEMGHIAPYQMPQIEGQVDQKLFGGEVVTQVPYFKANTRLDDKTIKLKSGLLAGLYDKTVVGFYPVGTLNPEGVDPLYTGTIVNSKMLESTILVDKPITKKLALESWIFVEQLAMGNMEKTVSIAKLRGQGEVYNALKMKVDANPNINLKDADADFYIDCTDNKFQVFTSMDHVLKEIKYAGKIPATFADSAIAVIKTAVRGDVVRRLEMTDENLDLTMEIIPVTVDLVNGEYIETSRLPVQTMSRGGLLTFNDQQVFKIKLTNRGANKAYFQILDIKSNNEVDILLPTTYQTPAELNIEPGTSKELPQLFVFEQPFGNEMLKLVATKEPVQLNSIVTSRGRDGRSNLNPLEQLLQDSYAQTRTGILNVPPESANIQTVVFNVQPKQQHEFTE